MRKCLAALAAFCLTVSAGAAEAPFRRFAPDYTYENGRILTEKSIRGETRYEYNKDGKLARKVFPKGETVDFYYDRSGRPVEARFSTGLVRTHQYDRAGKLLAIVGSDGYTKTVRDPSGKKVLIITGPHDFKMDLTALAKKTTAAIIAAMGTRPRAMIGSGGGGGGDDCGDWFTGDDNFGCWGGEPGGGEFGGEFGGDGDPGSGARPPERGGPSGNFAYESCMGWECIPANKTFRKLCEGGAVPAKDKVECNTAATRAFFNCEAECRYKSY